MPNDRSKILLVDDEPNNLLLLQELLRPEGYQLASAASGQQAIALAQSFQPDLILLDIMMPGMNGYEVCHQLRQNEQLKTIPVIFLTALDDEASRLKGLELMGDDYLTKPINIPLLLAKVASILRLSQLRSHSANVELKQQVREKLRQQISVAWEINQELSEKFHLFVPKQYLQRIAPQGVDSIKLGNSTEEELTILFCDIRGFTTISESQSAQETFAWLNAFFSQMNQAFVTHHGFIDKYLGDAIMAVFDRPQFHAIDAIQAAIAMRQSLQDFNENRHQYNLNKPINIGIGIHTGLGLIGTLGSDRRMDSTVIGDVVNTASRIESLTKFYGCSALASHVTIAHVKQTLSQLTETESTHRFLYRWIDSVTPRGKQKGVDLYEILGSEAHPVELAKVRSHSLFQLGIEAWQQENITLALQHFQSAIALAPQDSITKLYIKRCQDYLDQSHLLPSQAQAI